MRAIVTGANGFVGRALTRRLLELGYQVLAVDIGFSADFFPKEERLESISLSVDNIETLPDLVGQEKYDLFYHFAWRGSAGPLRSDPKCQADNALSTLSCMKVAASLGCKKFIGAGSIMEFESLSMTYQDGSSLSPNAAYSSAKVFAHQLCQSFAASYGIQCVWAYITNAYGVGEISPRFINSVLRKISHGEDLDFSAATQNYDFVYIDDVAEAFALIGQYGKNDKSYLIGSGHAGPLKEFVLRICRLFPEAKKPNFGAIPGSGINLPIETYSIQNLIEDCGFECRWSFEDGLSATMNWLRSVDEHKI